ncbi:MAG: OFA family MFS transporter [Armatimonadetes bacterium]|nr:OFA family MFS transporter [Armatimonadota bacterium]
MSEASSLRVPNRWLIVVGGSLIQLCLGAIYAWSAFTGKLTDHNGPFAFTKVQTQIIFSTSLFTFAVIMALIAGKWQTKAGPRKVALVGGLVMGLGYIVSSLMPTFAGMMLGVGLIAGAGIGLTYVCPIAALVKWFPDKKGLITGLAVAGFGFGALIWVKLTEGFKFGPVDLTPGWKGLYGAGWTVPQVFMLYGVLFAALIGLGALTLCNPPEGWLPEGWTPPAPNASAAPSGAANFGPREMTKTPQYWGILVTFVFASVAGLMVIGVIKLFGVEALMAHGLDKEAANVATGTAMGLFYALANGFGRIAWGAISDRLGRQRSLVVLSAIQGVVMLAFYYLGGSVAGLCLGAALVGFNYGGNFALYPAIVADFFGNKNLGLNYPMVFLAYGIGGVIGPILAGRMGDAKMWLWAFVPAGIACLVSAVILARLRPPTLKGTAF